MRKHLLIAGGFMCLLFLAGCGTNTTNTTPTATPVPVTYPPGANGSGVQNPETLLDSHEQILSNSDYVITSQYNGPRGNVTSYLRSDIDSKIYLLSKNETINGSFTHREIYRSDNLFELERTENRTSYTDSEPRYEPSFREVHQRYYVFVRPDNAVNRNIVKNFLSTDLDMEESNQENGMSHITYATDTSNTTAQNITGEITIREDGFIEHLRIRWKGPAGEHSYEETSEISDIDLSEPGWLDTAQRQDIDVVGSSSSGSSCGTNDGDPSYDEDNDRDNDGLCDED